MKDALALLDFGDASIADLRRLLLRAAFAPAFLRPAEGRRFLSHLLTLDVRAAQPKDSSREGAEQGSCCPERNATSVTRLRGLASSAMPIPPALVRLRSPRPDSASVRDASRLKRSAKATGRPLPI
jgi:hypothetical protein